LEQENERNRLGNKIIELKNELVELSSKRLQQEAKIRELENFTSQLLAVNDKLNNQLLITTKSTRKKKAATKARQHVRNILDSNKLTRSTETARNIRHVDLAIDAHKIRNMQRLYENRAEELLSSRPVRRRSHSADRTRSKEAELDWGYAKTPLFSTESAGTKSTRLRFSRSRDEVCSNVQDGGDGMGSSIEGVLADYNLDQPLDQDLTRKESARMHSRSEDRSKGIFENGALRLDNPGHRGGGGRAESGKVGGESGEGGDSNRFSSSSATFKNLVRSLEDEFQQLSDRYKYLLAVVRSNVDGEQGSNDADELVHVIKQLHNKGEQLRALQNQSVSASFK